MKAIILFTLILLTFSAKSQSLKEALYSGKLKADTGAVIRKGDSLKIKENMAQKIVADSVKMAQKIIADSIKKEAIAVEKQNAIAAGKDTTAIINTDTAAETMSAEKPGVAGKETTAIISTDIAAETLPAEKTIPKDNNKIWKSFIAEFTTTIKSEVLTSGKVKKGAYSVLIEYEIRPDGEVFVNSVVSDPKSSFLEQNIKERLTLNAPKLNPVIGTNGKPRTVVKKQILSFVK